MMIKILPSRKKPRQDNGVCNNKKASQHLSALKIVAENPVSVIINGCIKGIGEEYSELLERAGIDIVIELVQRNAHNLFQQLKRQTKTSPGSAITK
ncbi:DUF4332 domain-containing protein [Legionella israelensis]|uniref:DUF4332 domain-containing protein n=1 Tax=Legionella israelensis TaxID=454 RepID=UPI00163DD38D|nr:DUF4332 domain-containing protein [Legionella israelensis]